MIDVVDLFAGLGGFSAGARAAGARVLWAANHWPLAVQAHARNHVETVHVVQDLHLADWTTVPRHDVLLASPSCQGHSPARGVDRPRHDAARATAWAVIGALEICRPAVAIVENVPEFLSWAAYPGWKVAAECLGYAVSPHVIDAADHGVPQHRERVFIVLTRSQVPLRLALPRREHVAAETVVEWDAHRWRPIARPGRARATLERIGRARRDGHGDRFLVPYYGSGSGLTGRSLARPLGTVTTLDRWAIVRGDEMRMLQPSELRRAMSFDANYWLPPTRRDAIKLLGNAVCPVVAEDLVRAVAAAA